MLLPGSYNYANSNPELKERMEKDLEQFLKEHPGVKAEDVPAELLTAPVPVWIHISVRNLQRFRSRQWQRIPDSLRRK